MKIKFLKECKDKNTGEMYQPTQEKDFEDERALEIISTGFAVGIENDYELVPLSDLKVEELRDICKQLNIPIRGTKEEIIERILKKQEEMEN